jgi:hypothetical protein
MRGISGSTDDAIEYLQAIRYDLFRNGRTNTHQSSCCIEDAFVFETLAAAEFAAVFVGGRVIEIDAR